MTDPRIYMLNALWYKPSGGEEHFRAYLKKVVPLIEAVGGRKLKGFTPDRALIGEFDADLVFFVEFPSWDAYRQFANSPEYHAIAYLLSKAVDKSLLIRCVRPEKSFTEAKTLPTSLQASS